MQCEDLGSQVPDNAAVPSKHTVQSAGSPCCNHFSADAQTSLHSTPHLFVLDPSTVLTTLDDVFLTTSVKVLLRHYSSHVLRIFSPLNHDKSPWRLLHFPAALRASIELEIVGHTAPSRRELLYAILTVSAYNLANTQMQQGNVEHQRWLAVGAHYADTTLRLLESGIRESTTTEPVPSAYNELVAAILSMVTVDVRRLCIFSI